MIRFVDSKILEKDYQKACYFDNVFGSINAFLLKNYSVQSIGLFWNLYNENNELLGNLSFVNDTFTICAKDDSCSEEVAQFINFWGNFGFISYNRCNAINLDKFISTPCLSAYGKLLYTDRNSIGFENTADVCKDINLYSLFCLFKESFPEKLGKSEFDDFNYDMNYRLRRQQSFFYGIVQNEVLVSALEVMCHFENNIILGCLATDKKHRGKGYASSLLSFVSGNFPNSSIYVFAENDSVAQFYKKLGFKDHAIWEQLTPARKD